MKKNCNLCGTKLIARWESEDRGWGEDKLVMVCPYRMNHTSQMQEAEELKQCAKRALAAGTLLDQDFFEVVGDSQESIEGWREFMGEV